jgi:hypothetical protein
MGSKHFTNAVENRLVVDQGLGEAQWHGQPAIHLLKRLARSWEHRAQVKKPELDADTLYDLSTPDFPVALLPFADHPDFAAASPAMRQAVLSCGWLAYNEKTVQIESKIVNPACMHIIDGDISGVRSERYRLTASQALVDESYHILLIVNACRVTRQRRLLGDLHIPQFELVKQMWRCQAQHSERWQKILMQLAWAIVSEVLVSDYLNVLSGATSIQPLHVLTTEIHRRDEAAHNALFKTIGEGIYRSLSKTKQEFFLRMLSEPAAWFANAELQAWRAMLSQIGFPGSDRMIDDCLDAASSKTVKLDLTVLQELYESLGVRRTAVMV